MNVKKALEESQGAEVSKEKRDTSCLGYIGHEILHSYMGIIINHYKDPY